MPTDRRGEVPPGMLPWFEIPVFNWHAGKLSTIYSGQYIRSAQVNFPEARRLSTVEYAALDRLDALAAELSLEMDFRPGDMQFIHNHQILHSRTDFEDWPEPERRRHLRRLWLRRRKRATCRPSMPSGMATSRPATAAASSFRTRCCASRWSLHDLPPCSPRGRSRNPEHYGSPGRRDGYRSAPSGMVVPFAGGILDQLAWLITEPMGRRLGQPLVVENRPGAGGNVGTLLVARARGDAHTVLVGSPGRSPSHPPPRRSWAMIRWPT